MHGAFGKYQAFRRGIVFCKYSLDIHAFRQERRFCPCNYPLRLRYHVHCYQRGVDGCRQPGSVGQFQHTFASAVRIPLLFVRDINFEYKASGFGNGAKHSAFGDITSRLLLHIENNTVAFYLYGNDCMVAISQSVLFFTFYPVKYISGFHP